MDAWSLCIPVSLFLTVITVIASADSSTKYVVPTDGNITMCQQNRHTMCLELNQYTNNQDQYFHSNTMFVFLPGNHRLNSSLRMSDVQNISFHGEIASTAGESVTVFLDPNVSLSWTNCDQIEICSLNFISVGDFEYRLMFINIQDISLINVSVIGNGSGGGCSAIDSQSSTMSIANSTFAGIRGQLGAILALNSSQVIFDGTIAFSNNTARLGGAVFSVNSDIQMFGTVNFVNNTASLNSEWNVEGDAKHKCCYSYQEVERGGATFADNSNVTINGCATFVNNSAKISGGALATINNSTLIISDLSCDHSENTDIKEHNVVFDRNEVTAFTPSTGSAFNDNNVHDSSFGSGGAIYTENSKVNISNVMFTNNYSPGSGGAVQFNYSDVSVQYITMQNNSGFFAGAMRVIYSKFVARGVNFYEYNRAREEYGGAVLIDFCKDAQMGGTNYFTGNIAVDYGGGLDIFAVQPLTVSGTAFFRENIAAYGSAVGMYNSTVHFTGDGIYENNTAHIYGGVFSIEASISTFNPINTAIFRYNTAPDSGGAITSYDSQIKLLGNIQLESNSAVLGVGGAMALYGTTKVTLTPLVAVTFIRNSAKSFGGAIYFADSISSGQCSVNAKPADCFLVLNTTYSQLNISQITLNFINNMADEDGSILYGGQFDSCALLLGEISQSDTDSECTCRNNTTSVLEYSRDAFAILNRISVFENDENSTATFSSPAEKICVCNESSNALMCDSEVPPIPIMPGQKFTVAMVALGQGNSTVQGTVLSKNVNSNKQYRLSPAIQSTSLTCTNFDYRLYVTNSEMRDDFIFYKLFLDGPCQSLAGGIEIYLTIQPCPVGFTLSSDEGECICEEMLQPLTQNCYIDSQSILRSSNNFWMALEQTTNRADDGFILHNGSCPLDYCVDNPINITIGDSDVQCHEGRVGILCGTCAENFSLALGSLDCLPCSNSYLALLIPFALSGIVVVIVLFLLHLTVAAGTINGLIFYANIIQANHQAFFPRSTINFFTVFIAWLNFDFGIETCFYDGLTIYAYSWLEFLFPLYLWVLIILIIVGCHYSQRISNSLGHNPVAVLDTILLMSYSKILKAIIVPLSPTSLIRFPGASTERVWLYDASISYFQEPHHIVLGIFAIFTLLVLFLPYTFLLLCGQWLQAKSHWRILSWINKLKPFMDAYHAPYRKNKRHWIGIYLLARCGLFVTFALNAVGDYDVNLLAVCSVVAGLSIIKGRVYEKRYNDFLESSFLLNLCIFSVATFYVSEEVTGDRQSKIQSILSGISVGIAFVYFIGILVFHMYQQLKSIDLFGNIFHFSRKFSDKETADDQRTEPVTNSSINLRELLLDDSHE